jgi:hypothetical protein
MVSGRMGEVKPFLVVGCCYVFVALISREAENVQKVLPQVYPIVAAMCARADMKLSACPANQGQTS